MTRFELKKRNRKIIEMFDEGYRVRAIAKKFNLSLRGVYYIIERRKKYVG